MAAPLFEFRDDTVLGTQPGFYTACGKRVLDILLVLVAVPVMLPLLVLVFAVTALSGGQPLYSQLRIGRDGTLFRCWKVRTMVPNAESALEFCCARIPGWRGNGRKTRS